MELQLAPVNSLLVFLINVVGLTLIVTVVISKLRRILKLIFALMTLLMFFWVNLAFLARSVTVASQGLLMIKAAWSITPLVFILILSFILNFLSIKIKKSWVITLYAIGIIQFLVVLFTGLVINDIFYVDGVLNIDYGPLVWGFFGTVGVLTVINFYFLIKGYKADIPQAFKKKIRFLIAGLTIFFVANAIFNIIFPVFFSIFGLYEFGDYSLIIFLALIAYATVVHDFFEVKVLTSVFLVVFVGSFLLLDAIFFSSDSGQRLIKAVVFST